MYWNCFYLIVIFDVRESVSDLVMGLFDQGTGNETKSC